MWGKIMKKTNSTARDDKHCLELSDVKTGTPKSGLLVSNQVQEFCYMSNQTCMWLLSLIVVLSSATPSC